MNHLDNTYKFRLLTINKIKKIIDFLEESINYTDN